MYNPEWAPSPNFAKGRRGYKPLAIVDHITDGSYPGSLDWLRNPASKVSTHYSVTRAGQIFQMVKEEDTAWGNGRVYGPTWSGLIKNLGFVVNPNYYTISIEHEGFPYEPLTEAQYQATLWLHTQIIDRYDFPIDDNHIIGHYRIYALKPNCPGRNFPWEKLFADLAQTRVSPSNSYEQVMINVAGTQIQGLWINDRAYAPVRDLMDAMGHSVQWSQQTKEVDVE
ncbi:MAG: N-acetylmuramoyl-L-alanine amidase [Acidobacteriota bacterium]